MDIGKRIRLRREELGLSQDDLAKRVGYKSRSSITKIENDGRGLPQEKIVDFAKALYVTPAYLMGWTDTVAAVKPLSPIIKKIVATCETLTDEGQDVVFDHAELVKASGKYDRPAEQVAAAFAQPTVTYSVARAAAGAGAFNDGYAEPELRLIKSETIPTHDAVIDIVGDSMEPSIKDGDVAFINCSYIQTDGKLYAVNIGEETVVKRVFFHANHSVLVSDNPAYQDRIITEADNASIAGEVVGWTTPIRE